MCRKFVVGSLSMKMQGKGKRPKDNADSKDQSSTMSDLQWPPQEDDFVIMLQEEGWGLGSVQSFDPDCDICVQSSMALKTRAKDDKGRLTGSILMWKLLMNFKGKISLTLGHL